MPKITPPRPDYWSVYRAINFRRFDSSREFIDATNGKKYRYSFSQSYEEQDFWMRLCRLILWSSPAMVIVLLAGILGEKTLLAFPLGIFSVIGYHFLGMYYVIRGPFIQYEVVGEKKKFFTF